MQLLTDQGLHDIEDESWNPYGQFTFIDSFKPRFPAQYTNLNGSINSLLPTAEQSFTGTATLYLGLRLWIISDRSAGAPWFEPASAAK